MLIGFRYNDADESPALGRYGGDLLCRRKGKQTIGKQTIAHSEYVKTVQ